MIELKNITGENRLFTYKVAYDGGSAPNPYGGICTLAICKPKIRSVAKPGDVVVGFGCKEDELRIVYCMIVDENPTWEDYIKRCNSVGPDSIKKKIPKHKKDQGDCIWYDSKNYAKARESSSNHDGHEDFDRDVTNGKRVLIGSTFWYFGAHDKNSIIIPDDNELVRIVPRAQGHRSTSNKNFHDEFVKFFNAELIKKGITKSGKIGTPKDHPDTIDEKSCSRCRAAEKESDSSPEEFD
jgi:hypothetical protein